MTAAKRKSAPRARKTVHFDAQVLNRRIEEAIDLECRLCAERRPRWAAPSALPPDQPAGRAVIHHQALALLKAFCDAARPAGGLPLTPTHQLADLPRLLAAGAANAEHGDSAPKLLEKVRNGKPVDLRIALAVLHFLRFALDSPSLALFNVGAIETDRQRTVRRLGTALNVARHELPASVYEALLRRAEETAGYAYLMAEVAVHYSKLRHETDALGLRRMLLTRTMRYQPIRLLGFADRMSPGLAYELYDAAHVRSARLFLQPAGGKSGSKVGAEGSQAAVEFPLLRRERPSEGILAFELAPGLDAARQRLLAVDPAGTGAAPVILWEEELVFNPADRDILAWYLPVHGLRIEWDEAVHREVAFSVGDSPGLQALPRGCVLDRTLMPREVIAVRMWLRELQPNDWAAMGSRGALQARRRP